MTRRRIAAALFALCGAVLLLTWHDMGRWWWVWQHSGEWYTSPAGLRYLVYVDADPAKGIAEYGRAWSLGRMGALDLVLKVAGIAFLAGATLLWPKKPPNKVA